MAQAFGGKALEAFWYTSPSCSRRCSGLFRLDAGVLDHLAPLAELDLDKSSISLGELENASKPTRPSVVLMSGLSMILRSSVLSCVTISGGVCRPERRCRPRNRCRSPSTPASSMVGSSGNSELRWMPRHRQRAQRARFDVRQPGREVGEHHRHPAGDQVLKGRRRALVGHVQHVDVGPVLERLAGDDAGGVGAGERQSCPDWPWRRRSAP